MNLTTPQVTLGSVIRIADLPRTVEAGRDQKSKPAPAEALVPNRLNDVVRTEELDSKPEAKTAEKAAQHLRDAAKRTNAYFRQTDTSLEFEVGAKTGRTIIRVRDKVSGEVIREIPPEELVQISERMGELNGLLFDAQS